MTRSIGMGACLLVLAHLCGCQIVIPGPLPADAGPNVQRDAGYGLLLTVLDQESEVGGILMLKDVSPELTKLLKALAAGAKMQSKAIKALGKEAPPISWKTEGLPVPEIQARSWIANRTTVELLTGSGISLEVNLILTQLSASEYIASLAVALAKNEPNDARREQLDITKKKFLEYLAGFRARLEVMVTHKPGDGGADASKQPTAAAASGAPKTPK